MARPLVPAAPGRCPPAHGRATRLGCRLTHVLARCVTMLTSKSEIRNPRSEIPPRVIPPHPPPPTPHTPARDGTGRGKRAAGGGVSEALGALARAGRGLRDRHSSLASGQYALRPGAGRRDPEP